VFTIQNITGGKKQLERMGCRWEGFVRMAMNIQVHYNEGNFVTSGEHINFATMTFLHGVSEAKCHIN
jgi:hypothetical protein